MKLERPPLLVIYLIPVFSIRISVGTDARCLREVVAVQGGAEFRETLHWKHVCQLFNAT